MGTLRSNTQTAHTHEEYNEYSLKNHRKIVNDPPVNIPTTANPQINPKTTYQSELIKSINQQHNQTKSNPSEFNFSDYQTQLRLSPINNSKNKLNHGIQSKLTHEHELIIMISTQSTYDSYEIRTKMKD